MRLTEMYNPEENKWYRVADLPVPLNSARMELLDGIPTVIGGYDTDALEQNKYLYQFIEEENVWRRHPTITLRIPRSSAAVFPVPSNLFSCF